MRIELNLGAKGNALVPIIRTRAHSSQVPTIDTKRPEPATT